MRDFVDECWPILGVCALFVVLFALLVWMICEETAYLRMHHCSASGRTRDELILTPMSYDGKTTLLFPQFITHTQYLCDNGEHWT